MRRNNKRRMGHDKGVENMRIKNMHRRSYLLKKLKSVAVCEECCSEQMYVYETRTVNGIKRRRRICCTCGNKTTTYEIIKEDLERLLMKENNDECKGYETN